MTREALLAFLRRHRVAVQGSVSGLGRDRLAWPGIIHLRVRPTWLRYSDFSHDPPVITEFSATDLAALR